MAQNALMQYAMLILREGYKHTNPISEQTLNCLNGLMKNFEKQFRLSNEFKINRRYLTTDEISSAVRRLRKSRKGCRRKKKSPSKFISSQPLGEFVSPQSPLQPPDVIISPRFPSETLSPPPPDVIISPRSLSPPPPDVIISPRSPDEILSPPPPDVIISPRSLGKTLSPPPPDVIISPRSPDEILWPQSPNPFMWDESPGEFLCHQSPNYHDSPDILQDLICNFDLDEFDKDIVISDM